MKRRDFLGQATILTAGAVLAGPAKSPKRKPERRNERPSMRYARLGRTGLMVSRIVHGGQFTNRQRIPLLAKLFEGGVNLFDTAHLYGGGRSEEAFGQFFSRDGRRKKVFISTKLALKEQLLAGKGIYKKAMERAETALKRLRTDHLDIIMLHGTFSLVDYVENEEWLRAAADLKKQGKVRFIGISEHTKPHEVLLKAARSGHYDMAMVAFSVARTREKEYAKSMEAALKAAVKADMGVVAIKAALKARKIVAASDDPKLKKSGCSPHQLCYRYVLDIKGVTAVACGMTNMKHVTENLAVPALELGMRRAEGLRAAARAARVCGFCGTCLDACPRGVAVQDILRFDSYRANGNRAEARRRYAALAPANRASACIGCGTCEKACPSRVPIRRRLREAHRALS